MAGISFGVLGNGETCTGDPARRAGNEFVFQGLAQQNVATLTERQGQAGRHHLRPLLQHAQERVPRLRPRARGRAPHPAAQPPRARRQAHAGRRRRRGGEAFDHLPRPVLPRPPQPGLLTAARAAPGAAGSVVRRDGAVRRTVLLLRRRRCPHVDGGDDRRADQREPHHRGRRHRRRPDRRRLPLLPGDARRRADRPAVAGRGPRGGRGPRRRADAARLGQGGLRHPGSWSPPAPVWPAETR